ncbi:FkbM family methyltransferase [Massilia sp. TN1-12]|uniref:FkbM family methyltransferase n=1 Tax=Massilia paldalensis TaxID=3377675 RepID=UPI00384CF8D5
MKFISYAQNNEDVLLWRALGDIAHGFYIDVGANDPVEHSVTKAFYDAGWHGINIEPLPVHVAAFVEQRPRDINLGIAAGSQDGELTLYDVPAVRGWASPERGVAEAHRADGYEVAELKVPVRTLATVCAEHVAGDIHFLKIDVEGFEGEVLRGMDFARWRPWVLVIEATVPGSRETNHDTWEHLVTGQRYRFAWFDGLNRYYVAEERPELLARFGIQPNVFDDYIPHHLDSAWRQIEALRENVSRLDAVEKYAAALERSAAEMERSAAEMERSALAHQALHRQAAQEAAVLAQQCEQLRLENQSVTAQLHASAAWGKDMEQRLLAVLSSSSWRITAPLRFIMRRGPDSMAGLARRKARGAARRGLRWLTSREWLRRTLLPLIMRSPRLQAWTARTLAAAKQATAAHGIPASAVPHALRELPQSARDALDQLRHAYAPHKE